MGKDKKKLQKASSVFARAAQRAEEAKGGNEWEDGKYAVVLAETEITESQNGNKMVVLTFKGIQGQYKGSEIKDFRVVGEGDNYDEEKLGRFFSYTLKPLGIDFPEDESELEDAIKALGKKKLKVLIKVKTNGEYKNINIQKLVSDDDIDDAEGSEETAEDDDEGTELEVGMEVTAEVDGKEIEGTITKLLEKKGKVRIEDEDGEEYDVLLEDVTVEAKEDSDKDDDESDDDEDDDDNDTDEDEDDDEDEDEDDDEEPKKSKVSKKKSKLKK